MTKEDFISIFDDEPENILGNDWENHLEIFLSVKYNEIQEEVPLNKFKH